MKPKLVSPLILSYGQGVDVQALKLEPDAALNPGLRFTVGATNFTAAPLETVTLPLVFTEVLPVQVTSSPDVKVLLLTVGVVPEQL